MLGYILAAIVGVLLLGLILAALGGASGTPPARRSRRNGQDQPAADEPTPDRSVTATPGERDSARRHTPPA